ncbi:MAG TPA: hypothetical protein VGX45_10435, partial [Solirubrobacteraceae bacterium]|nr:hypothetical protein [Solirubrobacteraceae bacterium]
MAVIDCAADAAGHELSLPRHTRTVTCETAAKPVLSFPANDSPLTEAPSAGLVMLTAGAVPATDIDSS